MEKSDNEVQQKIVKSTKNLNSSDAALKTLEILGFYANDYLKEINSVGEKTKVLPPHGSGAGFSEWLSQQAGFVEAKKKVIKKGLMSANQTDCITLEFICANAIKLCSDNVMSIRQAIVPPKQWHGLAKKYKNELHYMSRTFESELEEHLFVYLINKLQSGQKKNIYNSSKKHSHIYREFLTKRIMQGVLSVFGRNLTVVFVADIALLITGIFFDPMDRDDARKLVRLVKENVFSEQELLQKTIKEIIFS